jgi:hypothetical protein
MKYIKNKDCAPDLESTITVLEFIEESVEDGSFDYLEELF